MAFALKKLLFFISIGWVLVGCSFPKTNIIQFKSNEIRHDSVYLFVDSSNTATLEQLAAGIYNDKFQPNTKVLFRSQCTNCTYWVKYKITNKSGSNVFFIHIPLAIKYADIYIQNVDSGFISYQSGWIKDRQFPFLPENIFMIEDARRELYCIQKIRSDVQTGLGRNYFTVIDFIKALLLMYVPFTAMVFVLLTIALFSLQLLVLSGEKIYGYYGFYLICFLLHCLVRLGMHKYIAPADSFISNLDYYTIPYSASIVFIMLYLKEMAIKNGSGVFYRKFINGFVVLRLVLLFLPYLLPSDIINWRSAYTDFLMISISFMAFLLLGRPKKDIISFLMLISFMLILFKHFINTNLIDVEVLTNRYINYFNTGLAEALVSLLGLAFQYRNQKQSKEYALLEINKQREESISILEKRVAERTLEIERINEILHDRNVRLEENIIETEKKRIENKELTFEEFKKIYPDEDACYKLIEDLKWANGFGCKSCGNTKYSPGNLPYSRRCSKCRKIETVLGNTLFAGIKMPIEKACYMAFLVSSGRKQSIVDLTSMLQISKPTAISFKAKIMARIADKKHFRKSGPLWQKIFLD